MWKPTQLKDFTTRYFAKYVVMVKTDENNLLTLKNEMVREHAQKNKWIQWREILIHSYVHVF